MLTACLDLLLATQVSILPLTVSIDAREANFGLVHTRETIPVKPGRVTLSFPKWIPGHHSPSGPINSVVNLVFRAGARTLAWHRDDVELFHFVVDVPEGVDAIEVEFDCASQPGTSFTPTFARLRWNENLLYPTGQRSDDIQVAGNVTIPDGWHIATPLLKEPSALSRVEFPTVSLTEFVDSPAIVGRYFNRVVLSPTEEVDIVGDNATATQMGPAMVDRLKQLIAEANRLFGARHYRKYDFLLSVSNVGGYAGTEHHECSEDGTSLNALSAPYGMFSVGDLLAHEFTHSWCGKFRRPEGLATADYDSPMKGELLWVYEGMTQYLGKILQARAGMSTPDEFHDDLARVAAEYSHRAGRNWRPLEDTGTSSQILRGGDRIWYEARRAQDYYNEAVLIWLEVDCIIRQQTKGQRTLDDFCSTFFGGQSGPPEVKPYNVDDIVQALNAVTPYDWATLLHERTQTIQPQVTFVGLEGDGWKLSFTETPGIPLRVSATGAIRPDNGAFYGMGARIGSDGQVGDLVLTLPAGVAGLRPGMKVVGVNGLTFSDENFMAALKSKRELDILAEYGGELKSYHVDYKDGLKYPHLQRDESKLDVLTEVVRSRANP